jgi:3-deoxy-D-manno-octulosonate 8-phosphate phosphatase (KDO 8-P phosphatase)
VKARSKTPRRASQAAPGKRAARTVSGDLRHGAAPSRKSPDAALAKVRLLALDVDGVLTEGRITYGPQGPRGEWQSYDVQDGIALQWLAREGVAVVWITGRGCKATELRAVELGIAELHQRSASKQAVLREIQARRAITPAETVAMGDDLPDLGLRAASGFFAAPANARAEIKRVADLVTAARGGRGAVRELCEHLLRARGRWQALVDAASR